MILGGASSGKSAEAERRLADVPDVLYVATGAPVATAPGDPDWAARVAAHRARRPASWRTVETTDLVPMLAGAERPMLIDCLTLWLTRVMDEAGAWDDAAWAATARERVRSRAADLADAWRATPAPVIAVSGEVGLGVVPETAAGRRFRDELGRLNQSLAAASDQVLLVVAGIPLTVKG